MQTDVALTARLNALRFGDEAGWMELLFREYYEVLGQVIYRVVPDRAAVEDLLQDVLLRVWQGRADLPVPVLSYRAYLGQAAHHAALRHHERGRRQVAWDAAPPAATARPSAPDLALADLHHQETQTAVALALNQLPTECRRVFELSRFQELSYAEIAGQLNISVKTVEGQMGKALRVMRKQLAGTLRDLYLLVL